MLKNILKGMAFILLAVLVTLAVIVLLNLKDRHKGYSADLKIINNDPADISAGFSAVPVTPDVPDRWKDINNDARFEPEKGDTYIDGNNNGRFDAVWIAGFGNKRAAGGVHDDLWARTMVIDDGKTRLAIVSLDAIGFMNDDVIDVRESLSESAGITYLIITSTHTHEGPDLLGLWGESPFRSGVDKEYKKLVKSRIAESVEAAVANLEPVTLEISEDPEGAGYLVKDTREPVVTDSGMRIIKAVSKKTGKTAGTLIAWADHPETLWGKNLLITSDFPHYLREGVEKGIYNGDSLVFEGQGGIAVYVNGAIGGLMTTHPSLPVRDLFTDIEYSEPSFEKALAQGKRLAMIALGSMSKPADTIVKGSISIITKSINLPIDNKLFKLGTALGIFDRGTSGWMKMRSKLAAFKIGPVTFVTMPGEVYPEIINGGIDAVDGRDFITDPVEIPSVREMMPGRYKFILGLANDEIGYIIPKSQWDVREPFSYGRKDAQYGEENSLGPETAPLLHKHLKEMLFELR